MRNFPGILQNSKLKTLQKFLKITRTKISQPPYVLWSEGVGGEPVQPWRTLRANAGCALFVFLLYRFPFCNSFNSVSSSMFLYDGPPQDLQGLIFQNKPLPNFLPVFNGEGHAALSAS